MLAIWTRRQTFIHLPDDDDQVEVVQSRNKYRVCHQISNKSTAQAAGYQAHIMWVEEAQEAWRKALLLHRLQPTNQKGP